MKRDWDQIRARAIQLRAEGKSRMQIKDILGLTSNYQLTKVLRGTVPKESALRGNAKDDLHERARELRAQGRTYPEIAAELGVSKSSVSLWVRDLPREGRLSYAESRRRNDEGRRRYWAEEGARRRAEREDVRQRAQDEIGVLSDREILIAGAIAYWCEGAKNKPHRADNHVTFINSDPGLVLLFIRFLQVAGVPLERLYFRVHIHETADIEAAERYWLEVTGADRSQFRKTTLKRHNPATVRRNNGEDYRGCLRVDVRRGLETYKKIEGWALGVMVSARPTLDR
ncbi:helix-turn-helix domain-containing protein [Nonomuraea sp. NPDC059023]|uniref:helix-turn-helix domain-containing protein n=1 Tax=unclassified Nonomuraea TaxID=2593643 RepID=UPI0036A93951